MARLATPVCTIERVEPHPNAERMDVVSIAGTGYRCCVGKGSMRAGDQVVYIADGALVPADILAAMGLNGRLAGPDANRVKPLVLRGVLSEGLVVPLAATGLAGETLADGEDVGERLGVRKYEPKMPEEMLGQLLPAHAECLDFDVEDAKRFPGVIAEGEPVAVTEKIHGVMACLGWGPETGPVVTGKGLGAKGLKFDTGATRNESNLYVRAWRTHANAIEALHRTLGAPRSERVYVLAEIAGRGVQKLDYGCAEPTPFAFDVFVGTRREGRWLDHDAVRETCAAHDIRAVPTIYRGPYAGMLEADWAEGPSHVDGAAHRREGAIVRLERERTDARLGRVIVKRVSVRYLGKSTGEEVG